MDDSESPMSKGAINNNERFNIIRETVKLGLWAPMRELVGLASIRTSLKAVYEVMGHDAVEEDKTQRGFKHTDFIYKRSVDKRKMNQAANRQFTG